MFESLSAAGDAPPAPRRAPRRDALATLVQRITQGFDPSELERARGLGYEAYLEEQLDHLSLDDSSMQARLAGFSTLDLTPRQLVENYGMYTALPVLELQQATLLSAVYSRRQLFERMVEFWTDHLHISYEKGFVWALKGEHDRLVIRQNALGVLHDLLAASAHGPAMLFYLDNWLNFAGAPQENFARELLELHALGPAGAFTEEDVREVARCFTGWTISFDSSSPEYLNARFRSNLHEPGDKTVLGAVVPAQPGAMNGYQVLTILCTRPGTREFLARELATWFLTPTPPQEVVDETAQAFEESEGDIRAALRVLLARKNMHWASPAHAPKFRRPFHFTTSLLRALRVEVSDALPLVERLAAMGHEPFAWPTPAGYPDSADVWGSSLLPRWTFASDLLAGLVPGVQLPTSELLTRLEVAGASGRPGLARRINRTLLGSALAEEEERLVQRLADSTSGAFGWSQVSEVLALAFSMPGYQWY